MTELSTLARPYSKAAFEYSLEHNSLEDWQKNLSLLSEMIQNYRIRDFIVKPNVTPSLLVDTILKIFDSDLPNGFSNFLDLLCQNKRLQLAPQIKDQFETHKANQEAILDITVSVTEELTDDQLKKLTEALATNLKRQINIQIVLNKDLMGGAVIQSGDMVIDNSVRGKLNKLADSLNT